MRSCEVASSTPLLTGPAFRVVTPASREVEAESESRVLVSVSRKQPQLLRVLARQFSRDPRVRIEPDATEAEAGPRGYSISRP